MGDAIKTEEDLVWEKEKLKKEIRILEHKIFIAQKQGGDAQKITDVIGKLKSANKNFVNKQFIDTQNDIFDVKKEINAIINNMKRYEHFKYFASSWGLAPILTAITAIILSFVLMGYKGSTEILGIVPLWALLTAVIGASVQILVGTVNEYKENDVVSKYQRIWYFVLPFVGFVFGFIAYLLIQAGLININLSQFSPNQTVNISELTARLTGPPINPSAFSIILCF